MKGLGKGMKEFKDAQNGESGSSSSTPTNNNTGSSDRPRV
jgi:hypothetical protein